jgi:BMFP domain-containing protein YqiC
MFDINTAINTAIAAAVAEATKPLVERIATLEAKLAEAALFERTTEVTIPVDEAKMVEALNSQEWFWEKVSRYITNNSDITVDELHNIKQRLVELEAHEDNVYHYDKGAVESWIDNAIDAHLENASHFDEDDIDTKIDNAIDKHEGNRTHGDDDDIEEIVQKLLNSASISITV